MATTIRYPSGLSLGLAQGIPLALDRGFSAYERARDRERQDLLTRLQVMQLQQAIQQGQEKQAALANVAANLGTVSRGMTPPAAPSQPFTMPVPEVSPGVDTPLPAAGTPGLLAGVEGANLGMTIPGATPQRPRTSADLLQDPNVAQAATGLLRAGIHPWGPGGLMQSPEDYAKQIKAEEDKAQAVKELRDGWNEAIDATDWKGQAAGLAKSYAAGIPLGKWPDQGDFLRFLKDEKEVEAMKEALPELQPILRRIRDRADTPEDMDTLVRLNTTSRSKVVRERAGVLVDTAIKAYGSAIQPLKRYYEIRQQNPMLKPLDAWQQVEQTLPAQAALARKEKLLPAEVAAAFAEQKAFAEGKAGEEGKRAGVPKEERDLELRRKKAQAEAEEALGESRKALTEARKSGKPLTEREIATNMNILSQHRKRIAEDVGMDETERQTELESLDGLIGDYTEELVKIRTTRGAPKGAPPAEKLSRKDPRYKAARDRGLTDAQIQQQFSLKLVD